MICPNCKREVESLIVVKVQRKVGKDKENLTEILVCDNCVGDSMKLIEAALKELKK